MVHSTLCVCSRPNWDAARFRSSKQNERLVGTMGLLEDFVLAWGLKVEHELHQWTAWLLGGVRGRFERGRTVTRREVINSFPFEAGSTKSGFRLRSSHQTEAPGDYSHRAGRGTGTS